MKKNLIEVVNSLIIENAQFTQQISTGNFKKCDYSTVLNRRTGPIKSIGRNFLKNLINVQEDIDPNNSIGAFFS